MYLVILAGGHGTRLWPVSRKNSPKQSECFFDKKTLLQLTYDRALKGFKKENIFISCGRSQFPLLSKQLKNVSKENFIIEPEAKGTAMAIGFACIKLLKKDENATIAIANSDHFIKQENEYLRILSLASKVVEKNPKKLMLVGIKPQYPETGYGYIELGKLFSKIKNDSIYNIIRFKEKPDLKTAKKYLSSGKFYWNPAWFVFKAKTMIDLFEKYLPKHFNSLDEIYKSLDKKDLSLIENKSFSKVENISIDYGIMEKTHDMLLVPANISWYDVGHWRAVGDCFIDKNTINLEEGKTLVIESKNNLIINKNKDKLLTVLGVDNLVVIDTKDALFICPKDKSQEVKKVIDHLKKDKKLSKYL